MILGRLLSISGFGFCCFCEFISVFKTNNYNIRLSRSEAKSLDLLTRTYLVIYILAD